MGESGTRTERDGARAACSRKRPTGPHNNKKVAVLGSMLGPSALFNTGYRHGANGDGKEPRSVPVLRLLDFLFRGIGQYIFQFYMNLPYDTY
eukprot:scaffold582950_cov157-Attheya_sp.AAC.1